MPFDLLKKKLMSRLDSMGIRVLKVYEEVSGIVAGAVIHFESSFYYSSILTLLYFIGVVIYTCRWIVTKHRTEKPSIRCCSQYGASCHR
jgi:hypothetical protein